MDLIASTPPPLVAPVLRPPVEPPLVPASLPPGVPEQPAKAAATATAASLSRMGCPPELEHPLQRRRRPAHHRLGQLDARLHVAQGQIDLFERVALHVRTDIAGAAAFAECRDQRLAGGGLLHLVEDAALGGH